MSAQQTVSAETIHAVQADKAARKEAYEEAERIEAAGRKCYVRNWWKGEYAWHVIDYNTYERISVHPG